ncbi:MAG: hypothetical protein MJZ61_02565 [Bacteroidales bacterium]|nr:hypothetical protein [Bacteroidales bacterium]
MKNKFKYILAVAAMAMVFSSCSKDEKDYEIVDVKTPVETTSKVVVDYTTQAFEIPSGELTVAPGGTLDLTGGVAYDEIYVVDTDFKSEKATATIVDGKLTVSADAQNDDEIDVYFFIQNQIAGVVTVVVKSSK